MYADTKHLPSFCGRGCCIEAPAARPQPRRVADEQPAPKGIFKICYRNRLIQQWDCAGLGFDARHVAVIVKSFHFSQEGSATVRRLW